MLQRLTLLAATALLAFSCADPGAPQAAPAPAPASGDPGGVSRDRSPASLIGDTCRTSDPNHLCLGIKFVSFTDTSEHAVADAARAITNMRTTNAIWQQCNIAFQIDEYTAVNPVNAGLDYGAASANETDQIRKAYGPPDELLLVYTGPWGTVKNAWTQMPGAGIYGAVVEASVVSSPEIQAHELGHYLGLDHMNDMTNLMNAVIYPAPAMLTAAQCQTARAVAQSDWRLMLR